MELQNTKKLLRTTGLLAIIVACSWGYPAMGLYHHSLAAQEGVPITNVTLTTKDAKGQPEKYETLLGRLDGKFTIVTGKASLSSGKKLNIHSGVFGWDAKSGLKVKGGLEVASGVTQVKGPPAKITLVQEKGTDQWIATDGVLYFKKDKLWLVEGQTVKVVGGARKPIRIAGKPLADVTVEIKKGKPVKKGP